MDMRMNIKLAILVVAALITVGAVGADPDPADWGIHNGCITTNRIDNVRAVDSKSAIIDMVGGKKILMRFRNTCRGLKFNGLVYSSRTGKLCAKFDSIRVLDDGHFCMLESFEPYVEPDAMATTDNDSSNHSKE